MVGVVPDLNETLRYAGDCSVPWNEDGVIWITSENAAGERGVQAIDVTTDLISLFRDAAGGSTTFAQATDTNKASLVTAAGEYSHALFNATSPSDHYAMSPSAAINTEAAHSFGGVLLCSTTSAAGFMGRYVSATDRNYVGRAGVSPLDNWSYMRGASIINSPVTTTKKFAFMCSFDPAAGALGTIKRKRGLEPTFRQS